MGTIINVVIDLSGQHSLFDNAPCKAEILVSEYPCCVVNALTSFKWKESSPRLSAPKMSHTGMCPRVALVLSLEYERPLFVKTKNLFLKFLNPNLLLP